MLHSPDQIPRDEGHIKTTEDMSEDQVFPIHKTRSFSFAHPEPLCSSTPKGRRPSLNSTFKRLLKPKINSNNSSSTSDLQICRYLQSPERSRVFIKNTNLDVSPIIPRHRETSSTSIHQCSIVEIPSPRKESNNKDFLSKLNCASSSQDQPDMQVSISTTPDPSCKKSQCPPLIYSSSNVCLNNNAFFYKPENPCSTPVTPLLSRKCHVSSSQSNFIIAKSQTTDAVRRPSDFPKTNFHLFGYRGRNRSIGGDSGANSVTSTPLPKRNRFGSVPSIQFQCEENENEKQGDDEQFSRTAINSTPVTPDLSKNRNSGNFMRRSATIAFSKGRKLSGLLGYSIPRR